MIVYLWLGRNIIASFISNGDAMQDCRGFRATARLASELSIYLWAPYLWAPLVRVATNMV